MIDTLIENRMRSNEQLQESEKIPFDELFQTLPAPDFSSTVLEMLDQRRKLIHSLGLNVCENGFVIFDNAGI